MSLPTADLPGPAWLFCPANRPERFTKAAAHADMVILDLEDGVAATERPAARNALIDTPLDPTRTIVRVNPAGSDDHATDLAALQRTAYRRVMLAKTESADHLAALGHLEVIALCETPAGVQHADQIGAADRVIALMWGAEDLIAALGGDSSRFPGGQYRDVARHARSTVLLAAATHGKAAVDSVYLDIGDLAGLGRESADAVASGFSHKACIHPSQVQAVREAYTPTPQRLDWARRVLAAAAHEHGVFAFEGDMVDEPVLRHARRIISRASPAASG